MHQQQSIPKTPRTGYESATTFPTIDRYGLCHMTSCLKLLPTSALHLMLLTFDLQSSRPFNLCEKLPANSKKLDSFWTPERVTERARQLCELAAKGIRKQMKWPPSCRAGTTNPRVSSPTKTSSCDVQVEADRKPFKQKKIPVNDFRYLFGDVSAFCRYKNLSITGQNVKVHWNDMESTFKLPGTYGI